MKVGYIGLGALGSQLALRMLPAHELCVWDINSQAVARLVERGAKGVATAAEVARASDTVLLCLPRSADVRSVLFAPGGLASALVPGTVLIDQTSGIASDTRAMAADLARSGIAMMDAAVSASPHMVGLGQARLMAGGPDEVFQRARPVLAAITDTVFQCGDRVGDGQAMKTVNNAMNAGCRLATLEIASLGRKLGLSLSAITEVLHRGDGRNSTTERMLPAIAQGTAATDFALALMIKDLDQALGLGAQLGAPMPMSSIVRDMLQIGANTRGDDARLEDMIGVMESLAGTRLRDDKVGPTGDAESLRQLSLLDAALRSACGTVTLECIAVGLRYGLDIARMRDVLQVSSGWSAIGRQQLAALASGEAVDLDSPCHDLGLLHQVADLAVPAGVPLLLTNAARMQCTAQRNKNQAQAASADPARMVRPDTAKDLA